MPDLHEWITQQVDKAEAEARASLLGASVTIRPDNGSRAITGTVTQIEQTADGPQLTIEQHTATHSPPPTNWTPLDQAAAILRRCEADRRILARHQPWPASDCYCDGCGPDLDTHISDCPELLDLAHAHGATDETLATLDRPQPPPPRRQSPRLGLADLRTTPMADVPPALRGPRWKG